MDTIEDIKKRIKEELKRPAFNQSRLAKLVAKLQQMKKLRNRKLDQTGKL